jgi:hypothetical protein
MLGTENIDADSLLADRAARNGVGNSTVVRSVAWMEIFPWLRLIRLFRIALQFRLLIFTALGLVAMNVGWIVIGESIGGISEVFTGQNFNDSSEPLLFDEDKGEEEHGVVTTTRGGFTSSPSENESQNFFYDSYCGLPYPDTVRRFMRPGEILLGDERLLDLSLIEWIYLFVCLLWGTFVWAVFGGAICRAVALQLTIDHPLNMSSMLRYGCKRFPSYLNAILLPFGLILLLFLGVFLFSYSMDLLYAHAVIQALWPFLYLIGFLMIILGVGFYFGWPLMIASIATDDTDGFDAVSRAYSYVYQRPLNALFYTCVAALLGFLGLFVVELFVNGAAQMADRAIIRGAGAKAFYESALFHTWIAWIPVLYVVAYFWASSVGIYILLRKDVDQTELDHIGGAEEGVFEELPGVPPIGKDERGAPVVIGDEGVDADSTDSKIADENTEPEGESA